MPVPSCPRRLWILPLVMAALLHASCGVAESIAEKFVDDETVTVEVRPDRSGTIFRTADGTDTEVQVDSYSAGDRLTGQHAICLLAFPLGEGTQLPNNTEIDSVTLQVFVGPGSGDPAALAPLRISHLPSHPDVLLTPGIVPDPPGNDFTEMTGVETPGWRSFDVTAQFLSDFQGGKTISAFVVRLDVPNNGDLVNDTVTLFDSATSGRARIVVRLSLDL